MIETGTFATSKLPDDNWNWKLGRIQYFREGGLRNGPLKAVPCRGFRGHPSRTMYQIEVLPNGISRILKSSQLVLMAHFRGFDRTTPYIHPRETKSKFELDTKNLLGLVIVPLFVVRELFIF